VAIDTASQNSCFKVFSGYVIYARQNYLNGYSVWNEYEYLDNRKIKIPDSYLVIFRKELHLQ
jgi:hypothetical protein